MTISNIRKEKQKTKIYAPMYYILNLGKVLQQENIEHEVIIWRKLWNDENSKFDREKWAKRYKSIDSNIPIDTMGCIISNCNTDDLFELSKTAINSNNKSLDVTDF